MKSIILARRHDSQKWELIAGPEMSHQEQVEAWRGIVNGSGETINDIFAELQIHRVDYSTEVFRSRKFVTAEQAASNIKVKERSEVESQSQTDQAAQRQSSIVKEQREKEAASHSAQIARLNKLHDAHRELFCGKPRDQVKTNIDKAALEEIERRAARERQEEQIRLQQEQERAGKSTKRK